MSKASELLEKLTLTEEESDTIWQVEVDLDYKGFAIMSSGEEVITDNSTVMTFSYQNEEDAKAAAVAAKDFEATTNVKLRKSTGRGYPQFKKELFLKILQDAVDPKVNQTIRTYRRYKGRRRRRY